jgi:hypothetical protein
MKELIVTASWYLWWIRRRRTRDETVPPIHKCKLSILSIVANFAKIGVQVPVEEAKKWKRPAPRQVKLNVDASFHPEMLVQVRWELSFETTRAFSLPLLNIFPTFLWGRLQRLLQ